MCNSIMSEMFVFFCRTSLMKRSDVGVADIDLLYTYVREDRKCQIMSLGEINLT